MKKRLFIWLCCIAALITNAAAQGKISGKVYDSKSGLPVEYATVAVLKVQDSSLVTGTVTCASPLLATRPTSTPKL